MLKIGMGVPLSWAAKKGHKAVVELLIEKQDIDIDVKDNKGRTPLMHAARGGNEDVVRLLIKKKDVDINVKDRSERTPFMWAAWGGHEAVVQVLVNERKDVDIDAKDKNGKTALSLAEGSNVPIWGESGRKAIVQLLKNRPDMRARGSDRGTAFPFLFFSFLLFSFLLFIYYYYYYYYSHAAHTLATEDPHMPRAGQ